MFTGIVERTGAITDTRSVSGGRLLRIDAGDMAKECALGSSVCVSGVCLTVTEASGKELAFDVIAETLRTSTLGTKRTGDRVNLERSLRPADRLDGHFVQGHVDGQATVDRVLASPCEHTVWLRPEASLTRYIIPKGSIAIDGVSLTVAAVDGGAFSVAFIPTTLERTTLADLAAGNRVNIETDIIARTVVHWLSGMSATGGLTLDRLREAGFA
jgi:riboflavin synthase